MRRSYRYSPATIARAYGRSAIGLTVTLIPLVALEPASSLSVVLLAGAALFLVYLAKSIALHTRIIVVDENGIRTAGLFRANVPWNDLRAVQLNYYTTRNDRSSGWIELVVRGTHAAIRIESNLAQFREIAARVVREAAARDCPLDDRTRTHMEVLGIRQHPVSAYGARSAPGAHHA